MASTKNITAHRSGLTENGLYYCQYGDPHAPNLVLLHSGGMCSQEWDVFIKSWQEQYFCTCFDLPGHGQSQPAKLSVRYFAQLVDEAIREVVDDEFYCIGSSLGSAVALTMALEQSTKMQKLVHYRMSYTKKGRDTTATKQMSDPSYWQQFGLDRWMQKIHQQQAEYDSSLSKENAWHRVIADVDTLMGRDTTDFEHAASALEELVLPVLLIAGDADPIVPLEDLLTMVSHLQDASLWVLPNASHITAANTWRKAAFVDEINRFLAD